MPAPYPADTRSKGWRFELDLERIRQSDTWALAPADVRPWLFLLWATAWEQVPCGSFPADDELIAARIGMAPKAFAKARTVLMRGWWLADDGRLYHDVIAMRVLEMLHTKERDKKRKAEYRARMDAERAKAAASLPPPSAVVPRDSNGRTVDSATCDDTGTGTGTGTGTSTKIKKEKKPALPVVAPEVLIAAGFDPVLAVEFIAHKDRMKSPLTERAWTDHCREAKRAGWDVVAAAEKVIAKLWMGFEARYVESERRGSGLQPTRKSDALMAGNIAAAQRFMETQP